MSDKKESTIFPAFMLGVSVGVIGICALQHFSGSTFQQERELAIKAGVAHWTINPTTGERKFEYITPTK